MKKILKVGGVWKERENKNEVDLPYSRPQETSSYWQKLDLHWLNHLSYLSLLCSRAQALAEIFFMDTGIGKVFLLKTDETHEGWSVISGQMTIGFMSLFWMESSETLLVRVDFFFCEMCYVWLTSYLGPGIICWKLCRSLCLEIQFIKINE